MKTDVGEFRLPLDENYASIEDVGMIADRLKDRAELLVRFKTQVRAFEGSDTKKGVDGAVDVLRKRIEAFGLNLTVHDVQFVDHLRPRNGWKQVDVHVMFEGDVIRFTEAPWHPDNCPGGKEHPRLIEMVKRGKTFTAVYVFDDQPNHREDGSGTLSQLMHQVIEGAPLSVIRRDWPNKIFSGKCRIDIRIEPKSEVTVSPSTPEAPAKNNLSPEGGRLTLMQDGFGGVSAATAYEVGRVLDAFKGGQAVSAVFSASLRDTHEAWNSSDFCSAAAFISDWLKEHGVKDCSVTVTDCAQGGHHIFRVDFQRKQ